MSELWWYHIELILKNGDSELVRVCDPHDPENRLDSVEAQKAAMDLGSLLKDPDGTLISGVSTFGHYLVIPDFEIVYLRIGRSRATWPHCHLDLEVFAADDNEDADIIQLKDIRLYDEED